MIDLQEVYSTYLDDEQSKNRKKYEKYKGWFSASSAGSCFRKQLYRRDGVEGKQLERRVQRLLRLGTVLHNDIENAINSYKNNPNSDYLSSSISIYTEHRIELPEINVVGHLDIAVESEDSLHVYDIKTCAAYKWKTKFGRNPKFGSSTNYNLQVGTYAMGIGNELENDNVTMSLLWYNKDNSMMREEKIPSSWIDKSFEYWIDLNEETEDTKPEELNPGSYGVPMEDWECRYCEYKNIHCPGK
tara:strand:- start:1255 stop:1986 length:732 start_codon:yes stop_codon:yes gene_type:complete